MQLPVSIRDHQYAYWLPCWYCGFTVSVVLHTGDGDIASALYRLGVEFQQPDNCMIEYEDSSLQLDPETLSMMQQYHSKVTPPRST